MLNAEIEMKEDLLDLLKNGVILCLLVKKFKHIPFDGPRLAQNQSANSQWAEVETAPVKYSILDLEERDAAKLRGRILELQKIVERQRVEIAMLRAKVRAKDKGR